MTLVVLNFAKELFITILTAIQKSYKASVTNKYSNTYTCVVSTLLWWLFLVFCVMVALIFELLQTAASGFWCCVGPYLCAHADFHIFLVPLLANIFVAQLLAASGSDLVLLFLTASEFCCHVGPWFSAAVDDCLWVLISCQPISLCCCFWLPLGFVAMSAHIFVWLPLGFGAIVGPYLCATEEGCLCVLVLCWFLHLCCCRWLLLGFGVVVCPYLCATASGFCCHVEPYLCATADDCLCILVLLLAPIFMPMLTFAP